MAAADASGVYGGRLLRDVLQAASGLRAHDPRPRGACVARVRVLLRAAPVHRLAVPVALAAQLHSTPLRHFQPHQVHTRGYRAGHHPASRLLHLPRQALLPGERDHCRVRYGNARVRVHHARPRAKQVPGLPIATVRRLERLAVLGNAHHHRKPRAHS